ncbi:MAG: SurA N-terminal domain-containing protein [Bacteroidales bacterium]|jgi:hypothetical protein|nr:SurA N-terminal domain-containing protein [Bacteroidales bacterium]
MAAIGKIRQHYGILVIIIGLALLAFVLGDLFKSTNRRSQTDVAIVNGDKISYQSFANRAEQSIQNQKAMSGSMTEEEQFNIRQQTLNYMIREIIMGEEFEDLGIAVTSEELSDQFLGEKPNQYVLQSFSDRDGNFDRQGLVDYLNNFDNLSPEYQVRWLNFENAIAEDRLNTKYESLLKHGFYMPKKIADRYNDNKNYKRTAEVYAVRYTTIPDSTVVVTEQDKRDYYNNVKAKYQTDATRGIDYVVFELKPSEADKNVTREYMENVKQGLASTSNVEEFVKLTSDTPFDTTWVDIKTLPADVEKAVADNKVGFVYGPYEDGDNYKVARIMEKAKKEDGVVKARLAVVTKEIAISQETDQAFVAEVNKFVIENKTAEQFNASVEAQGLNKRTYQSIRENTSRIAGIDSPREIVRWTFNDKTNIGDVKMFDNGNKFVVAVLTKKVAEGDAPYEDIVERYDLQIKKVNKGKMIAAKMKAYGTDYDKMINELGGEKTDVENITFDGRGFGSFGVEEKIGGTALGMKEGIYSAPIEGGNACVIMKVTGTTPAPATDYEAITKERRTRFNNNITSSNYYSALLDNADVVNNGVLFF